MGPIDILTPVIGLLAFLGYVWLLSFRFWIAMVLTLSLCYAMAVTIPFETGQLIYWATATGIFATALFAMSLLPTQEKFVIEVRAKKTTKIKPENDIIIDGTNVVFWDGYANLGTLRMVVDHLREKAMMPYVFFDASSQHLLRDRLVDEQGFAKALGLEKERVMVCPSDTQADGFILKFAKDQKLKVVSNDPFRDYIDEIKELRLVKGIVADGHPILEGL